MATGRPAADMSLDDQWTRSGHHRGPSGEARCSVLHSRILDTAKGCPRRILIIAGIGLTVAASFPPTLPPQSQGHGPPAGTGVGHKVG